MKRIKLYAIGLALCMLTLAICGCTRTGGLQITGNDFIGKVTATDGKSVTISIGNFEGASGRREDGSKGQNPNGDTTQSDGTPAMPQDPFNGQVPPDGMPVPPDGQTPPDGVPVPPNGQNPDGTPPDGAPVPPEDVTASDGTSAPDNQNPPDPAGDTQGSDSTGFTEEDNRENGFGGGNGRGSSRGEFVESGVTATFRLADGVRITDEDGQDAELTVGDIVHITINDNGEISGLVIVSAQNNKKRN